jgi:hypothetical protein
MHAHFETVSKYKLCFGVKRISDLGPGIPRRLGCDPFSQGLPRGQDAASGFGAFLGGDAWHPNPGIPKGPAPANVIVVRVGQDYLADLPWRVFWFGGCDSRVQKVEFRWREAGINDQSLVPGKETH